MEMTGLEPERDRIIEVATILTDGNLVEIATGPELVIHQSDEILGGMDDWNKKHHGGSGLSRASRNRPSPRPMPRRRRSRSSTRTSPRRSAPCSRVTRSIRTSGSSTATCRRSTSGCTTGWSTSRQSRSSARRWFPQITAKLPAKKEEPPRPRRHPRIDRRAALVPATPVRSAGDSACQSRVSPRGDTPHPGHARCSYARDMKTLAALALAASTLTACTGPTGDDGDPEDSIAVDDGKADDFLSASALEYVVTGRSSVTFTSAPSMTEVQKPIEREAESPSPGFSRSTWSTRKTTTRTRASADSAAWPRAACGRTSTSRPPTA